MHGALACQSEQTHEPTLSDAGLPWSKKCIPLGNPCGVSMLQCDLGDKLAISKTSAAAKLNYRAPT